MKQVQYVGVKSRKMDNIAGTGLVWTPLQVHPVPDDAAARLLAYPNVWKEFIREETHAQTQAEAEAKPQAAPVLKRALRSVQAHSL